MWLYALDLLFRRLSSVIDLSKIVMITESGQQHGSVYLDETFGNQLSNLDPSLASAYQTSMDRFKALLAEVTQ
jgi:hypothetical protein